MEPVRDPWLAANLSLTFAGLGQFYARRAILGAVLFAVELAGWGVLAAFLLRPGVGTPIFLKALAAVLVARLLSVVLAWRALGSPAGDSARQGGRPCPPPVRIRAARGSA